MVSPLFFIWGRCIIPPRVEKCVQSRMKDPDFEPQPGRTKLESAWALCNWMDQQGMLELEADDIAEMKLEDITSAAIRKMDDTELLSLHRRLHQLWGKNFAGNEKNRAGNLIREDLVNIHIMLRDEMLRRDMEHAKEPVDGLDRASEELKRAAQLTGSTEEILLAGVQSEIKDALYLVAPHAKFIAEGRKSAIVKSEPFNLSEQKWILASRDKGKGIAYGIIELEEPEALTLERFRDRRSEHLVTEEERREWWPQARKLYLYKIKSFEPYDKPKKVKIPIGPQVIIKNLEFEESPLSGFVGGDDTIIVPHFVTIAGSVGENRENPEDIDILIRADYAECGNQCGFFIRAEDVELPIRKKLDPEKTGLPLHWNANPQGPHATYLNIADLVIRWKNPVERILVELDKPLRIDLGCGGNKLEGYIGIDKRNLSGVDIVLDVARENLPFDDGSVEEVRAIHFLEDLKPEERIPVIREIWRVLESGGVFKFEVPHTDSIGSEMPFHLSHWTEETFRAFADPALIKAYNLPPFMISELETVDQKDGKLNIVGQMLPMKEFAEAAKPIIKKIILPKPADKFFTDHFDPKELWDSWGKERAPFFAEPKLNGFRSCLQKSGNQISIFFEDSQQDKSGTLPQLPEALGQVKEDFILDANIGVEDSKGIWSRIRLMTLTAKEPKIPDGARVVATAFDVIYWDGEDVTKLPFTERRELLESKVKSALKGKNLDITPGVKISNLERLNRAYKRFGKQDGSEGLVVKTLDAPYPWGKPATSEWSKIKNVLEVKALVLEIKKTKHDMYNFRGGLLVGASSFKNVTDYEGKRYIDLKWSFNAPFTASKGDIVTFEVEEIILQPDGSLAWLGAKPVDRDATRKEPYSANQIVNMARRAHVLQDARKSKMEERIKEEPTRAERAEKEWKENWAELVARGQGKFILQGHFPALTEEESKWDLQKLLAANKMYHSDLRMEAPDPWGAWGFSCFEGRSSKVGEKGTRLYKMPDDKPMRGTFKLEQPKEWLNVGKKGPYTSSGVGRVGKDFAKFFALEWGQYKLTFAREHAFEIIYNGDKNILDGRYIISYVPITGGERIWMIRRPEEQDKIYADEHDLDKVKNELRDKGQKWLFWRESLDKPLEKIEVSKEG